MTPESSVQSRNAEMAELLVTIITFSAKIEELKEKLCGFSSDEYSPEQIYHSLDRGSKGHLEDQDILQFLNNDNITPQTVKILFQKANTSQYSVENNKLTYLGYLNLLKPYFNRNLAKDLLQRDRFTKGKIQKQVGEQNQRVLLLLSELLLMHCVCVAEHQRLKYHLAEVYLLNCSEAIEIMGLDLPPARVASLQILYNFLSVNSEYTLQPQEMKYLLSYLQTSESQLNSQKNIKALFIPCRSESKAKQMKSMKQLMRISQNYEKEHIWRKDLSVKQINFLNFVHPQSVKRLDETPLQSRNSKAAMSAKEHRSEKCIAPQGEYAPQIKVSRPKYQEQYPSKLETPFLEKFMTGIAEQQSRQNCEESSAFCLEGSTQGKRSRVKIFSGKKAPEKPILRSYHQQSYFQEQPPKRMEPGERIKPGESILDQFLLRPTKNDR